MNTNVPANINGQSTSAQALAAAMGLGALSPAMQAHLAAQQGRPSDDLGGGITTGFAVVSLRGKVWRIKHRGEEKVVLNERNEPRYSLEVIIVKASPNIAKIFYKDGYVEGSTSPPDCWSVNGKVPDPASPALTFPENAGKTGPTCAGCWANAWGSRASAGGNKGKACADSKRIAIVPMDDPKNEFYGGPMLQRIPPASLGDLKAYADKLNQIGLPYYAVATRISFDMSAEYPKLMFEPIRVLTDEEAGIVLEMQKGALVERILDTAIDMVETSGVDTTGADAFKQLQGQKPPTAFTHNGAPMDVGATQTPPQANPVQTAAEQVLAVTQPSQAIPEASQPQGLPEGWTELPGGKFYHADHGVVDKLPEPPKPEPVTPEVTPALDMADFTPLPGGKFYQISTGQVLDALPQPKAPEPPKDPNEGRIALPDGNFYDPTTGQIFQPNGQPLGAPAPAPTPVAAPAPAPVQQATPQGNEPRSPTGRVYGKPRDGLKKRNSNEVAEDNAYFASVGQAAPVEPTPAPAPAQEASPLAAVAAQFAQPQAEPEIIPPQQAAQAENAGLPADFANMLDGMLGPQ